MVSTTRFGLSTHLFHATRLERDHLVRMRDAGFPLIEVFATRTHVDYHDVRAVEAVRDWASGLDLEIWSVHLPIVDGIHDGVWGQQLSNASTVAARRHAALHETRAAIAAAGAMGARVAVLHLGVPTAHGVPAVDNDAGAAARSLEPLAEACEDVGVRLTIEVIPNALSTAPAVLDWLRGDLALGHAGVCLDVGHAHMTGGVVDAIETLSGDIVTTHLHDNRGSVDDHLIPFHGSIDWTATLLALAKVGYAGPLMFELPDHGDVDRTLRDATAARERIQAILDDLSMPFPFDEA